MRKARAVQIFCLVAVVSVASIGAGCGGGSGSSFTEDEISEALNLRFEGADNLYTTPEGDCIVVSFLTSSDEVDSADGGDASEAIATNPDGTAGVVFGGFTSVDPDACASYAEKDLAKLEG